MRIGRRQDRADSGRTQSCLVFIHIPKTAGSTLSTSLMLNYPPHKSIRLDLIDRPAADIESEISLEQRARARLLRGHLPYGVHRHIPRSCEYITVLREPVARVTSAYKFIVSNPAAFSDHPLHDPQVGGRIGLERYLEAEGGREGRGNRQTRLLSGRHSGHLDREALEEAKRNLETFLVVGLTERFEETFALMRRALGLRIPFYVTRLVSAPFEISDHAVDLIRQQNELDLDLYAYGRDLFARQVARQGRSFGLEADTYRAMRPLSRAAGAKGTEQFLRGISHIRRSRGRVRQRYVH
jgi:hypothetical protein